MTTPKRSPLVSEVLTALHKKQFAEQAVTFSCTECASPVLAAFAKVTRSETVTAYYCPNGCPKPLMRVLAVGSTGSDWNLEVGAGGMFVAVPPD